jgi:hypothetical protein
MLVLSDYVEECYCSAGGQSCFSVMSIRFSSDYYCFCFVQGFERLINGQVLAHVDRSGLLSGFQSGLRYGHSTTTALVRVIAECGYKVLDDEGEGDGAFPIGLF